MKLKTNYNIPASYLVLLKDAKILLLKRFNTGYEDGKYSMIAGHVDEGEPFSEAVIREAYEEAGIKLHINDLKVVHIMHRKSLESQRVDVFFITKKWSGKIENKEQNKCSALSWFELENLPENVIPYIRQAIDNIRKNIFYSEYGWEKTDRHVQANKEVFVS